MNTKALINMDKKVKNAVMQKARRNGMTFTAVMNLVAKAYAEDRLEIDVLGEMIERSRKEIRAGKAIPAEEVYKRLGIKVEKKR